MSAIILRIEHTIPYIQAARKKRVCVRSIAAYPEKNKIVNILIQIFYDSVFLDIKKNKKNNFAYL